MLGGVLLLVVIMYLVNKLSTGSVDVLNANRYASVIEKTPIGKDTMLLVLKVGEEGVVVIQSNNNTSVIKNLSKSDVESLEATKKEKKEDVLNLGMCKKGLKKLKISKG